MANKRDIIADDIRTEIRLLAEQGVSVRSIAGKFRCSIASVSRIVNQNPSKSSSLSVPSKRQKCGTVGADPLRAVEEAVSNNTDLTEYQRSIANLSLQKAKAIIKSIDPEKVPEGQKAMTAGILIDKARLITGQAGSITEHRDVQVVALALLDKRNKDAKAQPKRDEAIIDIRPEPADRVAQLPEPAPDEKPRQPDAAPQPEKRAPF